MHTIFRHSLCLLIKRRQGEVVDADLYDEYADKICLIICNFVVEMRQKNGKKYNP